MIPKKKRRLITVDSNKYEYCISGCTSIFIRNLRTKEIIEHYMDNKPKWGFQIGPKEIRELIQNKSMAYEEKAEGSIETKACGACINYNGCDDDGNDGSWCKLNKRHVCGVVGTCKRWSPRNEKNTKVRYHKSKVKRKKEKGCWK